GDRVGAADDQQVVGHALRIGWAGGGAVAGEETILALFANRKNLLATIGTKKIAGLRRPQSEQRLACFLHRGVGIVGGDNGPPRLVKTLGVYALFDAEALGFLGTRGELLDILRRLLATNQCVQFVDTHGRDGIGAGVDVDAVGVDDVGH